MLKKKDRCGALLSGENIYEGKQKEWTLWRRIPHHFFCIAVFVYTGRIPSLLTGYTLFVLINDFN